MGLELISLIYNDNGDTLLRLPKELISLIKVRCGEPEENTEKKLSLLFNFYKLHRCENSIKEIIA